MRISDWSSDVCSSDLHRVRRARDRLGEAAFGGDSGRHNAGSERAWRIAEQATQIGRASRRERVCQYVYISGVAGSFKKKHTPTRHTQRSMNNYNYDNNAPITDPVTPHKRLS